MIKYLRYVPSVILFLLLPVLIISPTWQLTIGFSVFALFSFFFMREFNNANEEELNKRFNNLEDSLAARFNIVEKELIACQEKSKDINNSIAGMKMVKNMTQNLMR
jgi:hypothetical protein